MKKVLIPAVAVVILGGVTTIVAGFICRKRKVRY